MTLAPPISVGDTLASRYRLDAPLGRGAMGEVFRGHDLELRRDVAVKILAAVEIAEESRLMNEARAAAALNHPGLVAIYDVGRHGTAPFLVMELVHGADLRARSPRDLDGIARMALQLLAALEHAHQHGVVHRDLKPANVLVADSGTMPQYKLTDFGLALSRASSRVTHQGLIVGTAAYLAPEQALGKAVDGRADLYALGVMLYELVAGRLPFDGHDALTIVSQHVHAPVTPPRAFRPDIPAALERTILRLLAKSPDERYATAREAATAIAESLAAMSVSDATETQAMPGPAGATGMLEQLVRGRLVGRESELAQLRGLWERALQSIGHLALVSGEPGSGKTRLARELIVQAQVSGAVVLRGGCYEYEATTPYLPFVEALRLWVHAEPEASLRELVGDHACELAKLAPELADRLGSVTPSPPLPPTEERLRLFDHVARFFQRLAGRRGLLFFADDLQWADQGTLALLHYLLRHLASHRFLALGTYREIELDRRHPLAAALVDWNRERLATRIALGRLAREDTDRMLAVLLGQETVSPDFGRAVFQETEGNPFFVEEVVKSLIDQGQIYRGGGEWQRGDVAELEIPQSVKSAIGRRLDRLGETCLDVLRTAAALGKVFEFEELAACVGVPESQVLDSLDEALTAQLVLSEAKDFAFTHDKIREVLYEEMNPVRRRRLHQKVGEGLEKLHAARLDTHAQDLAHHFLESGDLERGLDYAHRAAAAARAVFAFDESVIFLQRAHECAEALGRDQAVREIDLAMADSLDAAGRATEAAGALERVLAKSTDAGERAMLAARIGKLYVDVGDVRAAEFADLALRDATPDRFPAAFALASAARARVSHLRGRHAEALEMLTESYRVAEREQNVSLTVEICAFLCGANQHLARFAESDPWAQKSIDLGRAHGLPVAEATGYEFLGENASWRGHGRRCLELAAAEIAIADRVHAADRKAWAMFVRAIGNYLLGDLATCDAAVQEGLDLCLRIGEARLANFLLTLAARCAYEQGHWEAGDQALAPAARDSERMKLVFLTTEVCHIQALRAQHHGDHERVIAEAAKARQMRAHSDARLNEQEMAPLAARALVALGRIDDARHWLAAGHAVSDPASPDFYGAQLKQVDALVAAADGDRAGAARLLDEAIASLDRWEIRVYAAYARLDRAAFRRDGGDTAGARADAEAALATFEKTGATPGTKKAREILASL